MLFADEGARAGENLYMSRSSLGILAFSLHGVVLPTGRPLRVAMILFVVLDCYGVSLSYVIDDCCGSLCFDEVIFFFLNA